MGLVGLVGLAAFAAALVSSAVGAVVTVVAVGARSAQPMRWTAPGRAGWGRRPSDWIGWVGWVGWVGSWFVVGCATKALACDSWPGFVESRLGMERPLSIGNYKSQAKSILPLLRRPTDPPPVANVLPGCTSERETPQEITRVLDEFPDQFEIVRGFKLVDLSENAQNVFCWAARAILCLRSASGRVVSVTRDDAYQDTPFIFVPSSLVYEEISNNELLSGSFQLGSVIGGDRTIVARLLMEGVTQCLFERNLFVRHAKDLVLIPHAAVRPYPFFADFLDGNATLSDRLVDVAIAFGMPFRVASGDADQEDDANTPATLLFPRKPWQFDCDVWLPSARLLHATLDFCLQTPLSHEEQKEKFMSVYGTLGREYVSRFEKEVAGAVRAELKRTVD